MSMFRCFWSQPYTLLNFHSPHSRERYLGYQSAADMPVPCAQNWNILFALFERDVYLDATKHSVTGHQEK